MFDLVNLIKTTGYIGIFLIVFMESGVLLGLFFPGDSLLFTAGFLASQDILSFPILLIIVFLAATMGDNVGYSFGFKIGPKIFTREDSWFFSKKHLERAQKFYEKYGGRAIILARFAPIMRTLAPIVAGVGKMHYRTFFVYNIIGSFFWGVGITSIGYFLGNLIPGVDKYLIPIIVGIIVLSLLPSIIHLLRNR